MIERKKKLRITQFILLFIGIMIIYFTYYNQDYKINETIISETTKEKIKDQKSEQNLENQEKFINIEYTGLDLSGNRYVLKSREAYLDKLTPEIIYMSSVEAIFYFKDDTTLRIWSKKGVYNNKTLDMKFIDDVKANYLSSNLYAQKADYSNSKRYLSIYENVRIDDIRGNLIADKLLFDIKKQKLNITSFNKGKINANVNLNEKRF
ncbi:LPS export ABC transporter periplasmic protein LptC [Candidatus Pelagibacter bacterium]|nr:LPS export ABC transporter periplasmic protein LptC [Candidatus Pelagibacter bacterium]|tara:strand:- start:25 stop:645 length:621 start_codon:yes stop_codon:yes gene_type:complete